MIKEYTDPKLVKMGIVATGDTIVCQLFKYNDNGVVIVNTSINNNKLFVPYHNINYIEELPND